MILTVLTDQDKLRQVSEPVDLSEENMEINQKLAQDMIDTMTDYRGVGLAAPQIGVFRRLIVANLSDAVYVMYNPEIIKKSGTQMSDEGCLSIPDRHVHVTRAKDIKVRFHGANGVRGTRKFKGMDAAIIQHEIDHLNGVLITDYETSPRVRGEALGP